MPSRRQELIQAAIDVFADGGIHALTHRAVDARAGLPAGSASNVFRTRAALLEALATEFFELRLADGGHHDERLSLAWLELLLLARRDPVVAQAISPHRKRMIALLAEQQTGTLPLTSPDLAALLTGLEFASTVVGRNIDHVIDLIRAAPPADGGTEPGLPTP